MHEIMASEMLQELSATSSCSVYVRATHAILTTGTSTECRHAVLGTF